MTTQALKKNTMMREKFNEWSSWGFRGENRTTQSDDFSLGFGHYLLRRVMRLVVGLQWQQSFETGGRNRMVPYTLVQLLRAHGSRRRCWQDHYVPGMLWSLHGTLVHDGHSGFNVIGCHMIHEDIRGCFLSSPPSHVTPPSLLSSKP